MAVNLTWLPPATDILRAVINAARAAVATITSTDEAIKTSGKVNPLTAPPLFSRSLIFVPEIMFAPFLLLLNGCSICRYFHPPMAYSLAGRIDMVIVKPDIKGTGYLIGIGIV